METQEGNFPPAMPAPVPPPVPPLLPDGAEAAPARRTKLYAIGGIIVAVLAAGAVRLLIVSLSVHRPRAASASPPSDLGDTTLGSRADQVVNDIRGITEPPPVPAGAEALFAKTSPAVVRIEVRDAQFRVIAHGSGFFVSADGLVVTNPDVIERANFATVEQSDGTTLFV